MNIQAELRKTIVCVTHDIDEAVKLGDRILILQEGANIAQYDAPEVVLAAPANRFVEDFVGAGSTLKQLTLSRVDSVPLKKPLTATIGEKSADVIARAKAAGERSAIILDSRGRPRDWVWLREISENDTVPEPQLDDIPGVYRRATLNDALDDMLSSSHGGTIVTGRRDEYLGVIDFASITRLIQSNEEKALESETAGGENGE